MGERDYGGNCGNTNVKATNKCCSAITKGARQPGFRRISRIPRYWIVGLIRRVLGNVLLTEEITLFADNSCWRILTQRSVDS